MAKPTRIITDPAEITRIAMNQPKVSAERMRESILAQNGRPPEQQVKICREVRSGSYVYGIPT